MCLANVLTFTIMARFAIWIGFLSLTITASLIERGQLEPRHHTYDKVKLDWIAGTKKAEQVCSRFSLVEKIRIIHGQATTMLGPSSPDNACVGDSKGIRSYPGLCLHDGPAGVRATDLVNSYPAGISMGASWNGDLVYRTAQHMGAEFRRKGGKCSLSSTIPLTKFASKRCSWSICWAARKSRAGWTQLGDFLPRP